LWGVERPDGIITLNMSDRLKMAVEAVPPELEAEAATLIENFLKERRAPSRRLRLDWAGGLSDLKDKYASGVDLAHEATREWADLVDRKYRKS
jgi:hypothetical protein